MSAGGIFGLFFNLFVGAGLWTILGAAVERIGIVFNNSIAVLPTMQDAVNGFNLMQTVWSVIMVIIFLGLVVNYLVNENSIASGEV